MFKIIEFFIIVLRVSFSFCRFSFGHWLSVFLRHTDSDYPIGICNLFFLSVICEAYHLIHMWKAVTLPHHFSKKRVPVPTQESKFVASFYTLLNGYYLNAKCELLHDYIILQANYISMIVFTLY